MSPQSDGIRGAMGLGTRWGMQRGEMTRLCGKKDPGRAWGPGKLEGTLGRRGAWEGRKGWSVS